MKSHLQRAALGLVCGLFTISPARADEWLDQLDEHLNFHSPSGQVRVHFSGLLDLEAYSLPQPPPGLINTEKHFLFNPRLTSFFDAQLGPSLYAFGQARLDRGFDPSDRGPRVRMDEYALRFTPWPEGQLNIQAGKFATVVGSWVARHYSWEDPFILAPGPYQNLTGVQDSPASEAGAHESGHSSARSEYAHNLPILWGPSYTTGLEVSGKVAKFDWAVEMKNAALSSRPETWSPTETGFDHPTFSGRLGFRPNPTWNFGLSASTGSYLRDDSDHPGANREWVLGQDISFARRHLQIWAEFYEARFDLPGGGSADTFSYYLETKYQFLPQLFGALRWNQQFYGSGPEGANMDLPFGPSLWRIDAALGYRFTPRTQLKVQYSLELGHGEESGVRQLIAGQFTVKY